MNIYDYGIVKDIRNGIISIKNRILYKKETISTSELFQTDSMSLYHHVSVALRYNFVVGYIEGNDEFINDYINAHKNYYRHIGKYYDQKRDVDNFLRLIKSFQSYGYKSSSELYIDEAGNVFNGAHRLALCVYYGVENVTVRRIKRIVDLPTPEEIIEIFNVADLDNKMKKTYETILSKTRVEA